MQQITLSAIIFVVAQAAVSSGTLCSSDPDGTLCSTDPDGTLCSSDPDGTLCSTDPDGTLCRSGRKRWADP